MDPLARHKHSRVQVEDVRKEFKEKEIKVISKISHRKQANDKTRKQENQKQILLKKNKVTVMQKQKLTIIHLGISYLTLTATREEAKSFSVKTQSANTAASVGGEN